jgi:hypothetical protein
MRFGSVPQVPPAGRASAVYLRMESPLPARLKFMRKYEYRF